MTFLWGNNHYVFLKEHRSLMMEAILTIKMEATIMFSWRKQLGHFYEESGHGVFMMEATLTFLSEATMTLLKKATMAFLRIINDLPTEICLQIHLLDGYECDFFILNIPVQQFWGWRWRRHIVTFLLMPSARICGSARGK